jgi:hypothetical protein
MELNPAQKDAIRKWVAEGCSIAEIQKRLHSEFGVSMTYLDVRFLLIDMGLEIKEKKTTTKIPPEPSPHKADTATEDSVAQSKINVKLDRITRPGALVSGSVNFSDGTKGQWAIDQFGRVLLETNVPGYRPSEKDMSEFQNALRQLLENNSM